MNNLKDKLFELSDEKYKKFHSGLCPNIDNIIGVRLPKLREIAKEIAKGDYAIDKRDRFVEHWY